eukprot:CAMPEP_0204532116 /NCGR_PEP_ID=MMETSP0661-20131031/11542_1 /ASSEMBLY_ACC=CAM_ASM_000606 /TAXON_ID=109239 /ORGANISM="Alexandrium margalefi, Strain AMGDE01CS-322" /LENGTH=94 /DNA_ID=CAMNT_0051538335 /DNA_START=67 /DNA_END=352 /DNA_ORIENTATION=-
MNKRLDITAGVNLEKVEGDNNAGSHVEQAGLEYGEQALGHHRRCESGKGVRPLFACKIGEEEAMWSKLDWNMVNKRLDITAGVNLEKVEGDKQR